MSEEIAEITWNPETMRIVDTVFLEKDFRFKCKRCAVFCCKLGGPLVTQRDMRRLRKAGYEPTSLLDQTQGERTRPAADKGVVLRHKDDGSCIFLTLDSKSNLYKCSIYDLRPSVCRLYPFEFQQTDRGKGSLRLIPCCNGLNTGDGYLVDRRFVEKHLLGPIMDLF